MQAICNGKGGMTVIWSDGSGLAACGSSASHRLHTFDRPLCTCHRHPRKVDPACPLTAWVDARARGGAA